MTPVQTSCFDHLSDHTKTEGQCMHTNTTVNIPCEGVRYYYNWLGLYQSCPHTQPITPYHVSVWDTVTISQAFTLSCSHTQPITPLLCNYILVIHPSQTMMLVLYALETGKAFPCCYMLFPVVVRLSLVSCCDLVYHHRKQHITARKCTFLQIQISGQW